MEDIKKRWQEFTKKYMNIRFAAIILITGVVLMCLPTGKDPRDAAENKQTQENYAENYVNSLEKRLADILSTISGVSDVSVMITVSDGGISTHEKNRSSQSGDSQSELSLKSQGSGVDEPVLVKKTCPSVLGVVVTAKGAGDLSKNAEIMSAVKAVLDVSAHRISVLSK